MDFLASPWCHVHPRGTSFASFHHFCVQGLGHIVVPRGHALWADVGGGITFVTSGEFAWQLVKLPNISVGLEVVFMGGKLKMLALAGQPSLHHYYACMVYWNKGALQGLNAGDVSQAWLAWSIAAETALADACLFSGGPAPNGSLVLGRGKARFRLVRLGGHRVRKVRGGAADAHGVADVFLYRDSSIASLLDMSRRSRAVLNVLDFMISHGVTLSRSVELTAQWGKILSIGPLYPKVLDDLHAVEGFGLGDFRRVVGDVHRHFSDFIHGVAGHRRDEAIRGWRNWLREDPMVHPYKWLRPDLVPPAPFLQCKSHLTPGGSGAC